MGSVTVVDYCHESARITLKAVLNEAESRHQEQRKHYEVHCPVSAVNQETNTGDSRTAVSPSRPMAELSLESDRVVMTGEQVKDVVTSTSLTRESSDWVNNKPPALISPRDNTLVSPSPPTASFARIGPYELGPTLGRGNFAVVKLAKHIPTKMKVAIKIMNKELVGTNNLSKVSRELEAMKRCQHPHIVRLYHVMETESKIFMVTEFASKGEVFDRISISRAFNEKEARELFWQIVCAIDFCHNSGVVHRDLKAENLLLDDQFRIKVADFGFCNFFQPDELLSTHCGSPQYAAPELFKGEPYDGPLADVWSLGVILYILVCGSFPFPGESLGDIRSQVLRGLVRFPFFLSTECEQMIRCMLQVDPSRRFKLKQVISTAWMQASPNVAHYRAMMAKYEAKAKCRLFDELFERQYPEHSEVAKADRIRLAEQKLDSGILRALALGAGLDEEEVRLSVLQNKCDRLHAAYQLFLEKVRRFKSNPHLRQAVNDALVQGVNQSSAVRRRTGLLNWRSSIGSRGSIEGALRSPEVSDGSCVRRNTQLATVPDVIDEAMTESEDDAALGRRSSGQSSVIIHPVYSVNSRRDSCHGSAPLPANNSPNVSLEAKCADSSLQTTSKGNSSERSDKDWHDPLRPNSLDFHVAMIILKADEDEILAELGLTPTAPMNPVVTNAMRRHTVQLTGSPLPPLRPSPEQVGGGFGTGDSKGEKASNARQTKDANQTGNANSEAPNANQQSPKSRVATYPLPRQVTQPSISVLRKARHPEQFLRAALDWMPNPWGWGLQRTDKLGGLGSDTPARKSRGSPEPQHLPSLDLGQEAATTKQPNARVRPGLQRRNSVQEEYDEEEQEVEPTNRQQFPSGKSLEPSSFKTILERQKSVDRPSPSPVDTSMQAVGSDNQKFGLGVAGVPRVTIQLRQQSKDSERKSNAHLESEVSHAEVGGVKPAAMETDVSETSPESKETNATVLGGASCWPPGREAEDAEVDTEADVLGTLLPQLNLPANLPPMIHQPVGRFTVKDPHLLAPPEFMTPQCSSFPRRSSDGAAELQPLHRPALAVGGSYPEPANYRNKDVFHEIALTLVSTLHYRACEALVKIMFPVALKFFPSSSKFFEIFVDYLNATNRLEKPERVNFSECIGSKFDGVSVPTRMGCQTRLKSPHVPGEKIAALDAL
ncbi:unnamed protein product [Calicophoron daubneyi]|uniref:non-specific serine/threonine protein kinase n=1 Tax=Calicophoron daubneyi TaxID=300641 RepID=A0AAV2THH8_CALDB